MNIELAKTLVDIIDNSKLREDYSGRGMFDETTTGIIVENLTDVITSIINCSDDLVDNNGRPLFWCENLRIDSMGRDYILY